jgi:hypothetical protein
MPSQLEILQQKIQMLETELGPDAPFVKVLKQQLSSLKQEAEVVARDKPTRLSVTVKSANLQPVADDILYDEEGAQETFAWQKHRMRQSFPAIFLENQSAEMATSTSSELKPIISTELKCPAETNLIPAIEQTEIPNADTSSSARELERNLFLRMSRVKQYPFSPDSEHQDPELE